MWLTTPFARLAQKFSFLEVCFHHCKYGSSRRKLTKLLHNVPTFQELELYCTNDHPHEPWGQSPAGHWKTSEETSYPWELCRAIAAKLVKQLQADGYACTPPVFALQEASLQTLRATTDIQPRRGLQPMVAEFKNVIQHPANEPLPSCSRKLSTPHPGKCASAISEVQDGTSQALTVSVGQHFTPEEFVAEAARIGHPTRVHSMFPEDIEKTVEHYLSRDKGKLASERTEEIKRWIALKRDLDADEKVLKDNMSCRRRTVLQDKSLRLFERLLRDSGHDDVDLTCNVIQGFDLTGMLPESRVFGRRVRPAAITCDELRRVADLGRSGILSSVSSSGDATSDEQLYSATLKEVDKGFLTRVHDLAKLPSGATITRRFGVQQKSKTRPIDDYKASFVNSSVTQTETASVHTVDHIAALISCVMRKASLMSCPLELTSKTWDLADAYKQLPLSDEAFRLDSYLVVFSPESKGPEVFQQSVLPFGSVASVTAFLRVAQAIWKLGTKLLHLLWTSYFDDFFSIAEKETSRHTDLIIAAVFSILGWKLSVGKLVDYDTVCKVLGVQFDLNMSGCGMAFVCNTDDRVEELCEALDQVIKLGKLKRSEGERLRGRLQFACGQLFGRTARNHIRVLSAHIRSNKQLLLDDTVHALVSIRAQIKLNVPRRIVGSLTDHSHVYVDASFEEAGYLGVGGALFNSSGHLINFFSEPLEVTFLEKVKRSNQKNVIQEMEMLALFIGLSLWCPVWNGFRVVAFTDSEAVRHSFLKTWSKNDPCSKVLECIFDLEENNLCPVWLERVPSQSNPVDFLSRGQVTKWKGVEVTRVDVHEVWHRAVPELG